MTVPPDKLDVLVKLLRQGSTVRSACSIARISRSSVTRWITAARASHLEPVNGWERDNGEAILEALAHAEKDAIDTIARAARGYTETTVSVEDIVDEKTGTVSGTRTKKTTVVKKDWRAAAWYLQHVREGVMFDDPPDLQEAKPAEDKDGTDIVLHIPAGLPDELLGPLVGPDGAEAD